ncbi:MAG: AarF/ABC1/UbiB kinase family protein [Anaerolineales bacterium]|nr:AarF/ABC1/UbiB kinase family protein [Anaerolineales bacterium]
MKPSQLRGRYFRILTFFAGVIARFILWEIVIRYLGLRGWVRRTRKERFRREAVRFRALAIRMGGVMIKVGQFLSSRMDVLPPEVTDELANLQDEVPAEDFDDIRALAEAELGAPLAEIFVSFDPEPLAAASLGQVHRARLKPALSGGSSRTKSVSRPAVEGVGKEADFHEVVVKVQRPDIASIVDVDLAALRRVGKWLMHYRPIREHADVPALLKEFSITLYEEIDYFKEADNAETFYQNFEGDPDVHVPRVVRALSTLRVLTLEDVYAIKITDYADITAAGIDRTEVAERLLGTYLQQIFEDGFVHADPHPGNLFITPLPSKDDDGPVKWQLTFVDFGMVARVPDTIKSSLREMLIAVGTRDSSRLVKAYQMLDMLLPGADLKLIEQAEAQVFDRFWGMSMKELRSIDPQEIREFAHQYRDLMLSMPFQVPQNLIYLARTVAILSGMCTGLNPDFNLWGQLAPFARKLVEEETTSGLDYWLDELGQMLQTLLALPGQASRALAQVEGSGLLVQSPQVSREVRSLTRSVDRLTGGILFAALLLGGVMLVNAGNSAFGGGLLGASGLALLWVLFGNKGK